MLLGDWQSVAADARWKVLRIVCVREGVAMVYTDQHRRKRLASTNDRRAYFL